MFPTRNRKEISHRSEELTKTLVLFGFNQLTLAGSGGWGEGLTLDEQVDPAVQVFQALTGVPAAVGPSVLGN